MTDFQRSFRLAVKKVVGNREDISPPLENEDLAYREWLETIQVLDPNDPDFGLVD